MKCINKKIKKLFPLFTVSILLLTSCGQASFDMPYTTNSEVSSFRVVNLEEERGVAEPFANDLCVVDTNTESGGITITASAAGLFDINQKDTIYAKTSMKSFIRPV